LYLLFAYHHIWAESTGKNIPIILIAMRALLEGRDNNPAHEEFFNSLISGLKKKNQCWDRTSVDGRGSTVRI